MESCRICMKRTGDMNLIFTGEMGDLVEKILFCTGVHLMEVKGLPSLICSQCIEDLTTSYNFKTTCVMSNNMYYKMLYNNIKKEDIKIELSDDDSNVINIEVKIEDVGATAEDNMLMSIKKIPKSIKITKSIERTQLDTNMKKKIGKLKTMRKTKPVQHTPLRTVQCEICNVNFKNKTELARHNRTEHKTTWICEVCAKVCKGRAALACHALSHAPRSFQCAHCEYATTYKSDLRTHLRRHTGERNYKCKLCARAFSTSSNLRLHERRWHTKDNRYQCQSCPKNFSDYSSLARHNMKHTGAVKRYQCGHCGAKFMHRSHWKKHLLSQHNVQVPNIKVGRKKNNYLPQFMSEIVTS